MNHHEIMREAVRMFQRGDDGLDVTQYVAKMHAEKWRDLDDRVWFRKLCDEVLELAPALDNLHEHGVEWELMQIASICVNWLNKRQAAIKALEAEK